MTLNNTPHSINQRELEARQGKDLSAEGRRKALADAEAKRAAKRRAKAERLEKARQRLLAGERLMWTRKGNSFQWAATMAKLPAPVANALKGTGDLVSLDEGLLGEPGQVWGHPSQKDDQS